ncbi:hypothetical protein UlMin_046036 [Ulmus minor]
MSEASKECHNLIRLDDLINALKKLSHEEGKTSNLTSDAHEKFIEEIEGLVTQNQQQEKKEIQPKIQKVPAVLRQRDEKHFKKYYEPRWISIGPIHHGEPNIQLAEKYKLKWTATFIADNKLETKIVYQKIKENIAELKKCFDQEVIEKYDDNTLSLMLFVDGCSILQLVDSCHANDPEKMKKINIKPGQVSFAQQDLLLLENQIPYQVLELLRENLTPTKKKDIKSSMEKFILGNIDPSLKNNFKENPNHLLDLLRSALVPGQKKDDNNNTNVVMSPNNQRSLANPNLDRRDNFLEKAFQNLLKGFDNCISRGTQDNRFKPIIIGWINKLFPKPKRGQQCFRGAGELKKAGINFRPSKAYYMGDSVKFSSLGLAGRLELPRLTVDGSMAPKFLNLIAYEMCPDVETKYEVAAYISLLDLLIDYPNDVKELRNSHVLFNQLGSDKEVANLFNEIATDLVFNFEIYKKVIGDMEKHCESKMRTWMAQVYYARFSSPWSIVAFLAAFLALALTAIQTWRALFPPPGPCDGICQNLQSLVKTNTFCDYFCHKLTISPACCAKVCKAMRIVWK